ncbi:glycosyltransferase family 2 protein [Paenarthrobacter sp. NPDC057981]|uniref:glycosyltransferase family 2 protein n=1 Tax=Paenarthrobacter sp. NPDC057981 TaxID=3346297 RepID=UPI0036DF039D
MDFEDELPDVSVVIPSIGREELARAIDSVVKQDYAGRVEIVISFDLDESKVPPDAIAAARTADVKVFTGGQRRGGFARNLGIESASGTWIAFLDDDDEWSPEKLRVQMNHALTAKNQGRTPIVGCRVRQIVTKGAVRHEVSGIPAKLIRDGESIEEYLFRRRRPGALRASFFTSTILVERSLCLEVPWDSTLSRHQDWDWLVRAGRVPPVSFIQTEETLVTYYVGTEGSISAGADWKASHNWATAVLQHLDTGVFVDFISAQTMRYALQKRDWLGVSAVVKSILKAGRLPALGPFVIGAAGLLPRGTFQNLMRKFK